MKDPVTFIPRVTHQGVLGGIKLTYSELMVMGCLFFGIISQEFNSDDKTVILNQIDPFWKAWNE